LANATSAKDSISIVEQNLFNTAEDGTMSLKRDDYNSMSK
jgi:hypothetical protein